MARAPVMLLQPRNTYQYWSGIGMTVHSNQPRPAKEEKKKKHQHFVVSGSLTAEQSLFHRPQKFGHVSVVSKRQLQL
jgi:hypothetical protein